MSPASSGALEVERYIGACLISSQRHQGAGGRSSTKRYDYYVQPPPPPPGDVFRQHHQQQKYNHQTFRRCHSVDGWAGGVPLISFANRNQPNHHHHNPINHSRRSGTVGVRNQDEGGIIGMTRLAGAPLILSHQKYSSNINNNSNNVGRRNNNNINNSGSNVRKLSQSTDAASVTSDESTGTGTSETTSLPRIIKPRKRRKKDRKPHPHMLQPFTRNDDTLSSSTSDSGGSPDIASLVVDLVIAPYFPKYNQQQQKTTANYFGDFLEAPNLHHRFEDVEDPKEDDPKETMTSCQCTYCNPADQIWDVSKNNDYYSNYSPFPATPPSTPAFCFDYSARLVADALSSVTLDDDDRRDETSTRNFIEISTEIVTSPNGHRDLEIKLFPSNDKGGGGVGGGGGNGGASGIVVREINNNNSATECSSEQCCGDKRKGYVVGEFTQPQY